MRTNSSSATTNGPANAPPVKLRLSNVTKTFDNVSQSVQALAPVNLEIREGEFAVLFGPSGCGKSTLLNIIAGFEEPSSGEITLDGQPVKEPDCDRLMVFQEHALFPWLNVIDNVVYGLKWQQPYRFRFGARRKKALELLKLMH